MPDHEFVLHLSDVDYLDVLRVLALVEAEMELEGRTAGDGGPMPNGQVFAEAMRRYELAVIDRKIPSKAKIGKLSPGQPGKGVVK